MRRSNLQIFAAPAALAVVTVVGLASALVADGWWDVLSWVALGTAAMAGAWLSVRRR